MAERRQRYELLELICAYCGKPNRHIHYQPPERRSFRCDFCKRMNRIVMRFVAIKAEDDGN
jgi:hypothetical protein